MSEKITIKQASEKFEIPISRIRNAIKKGWLKSKKVKGRWEMDLLEFVSGLKYSAHSNRIEPLVIHVTFTERFLVRDWDTKTFSTVEAANEFEALSA